ncbi:MAG: FAD-dependent tricarballylate dehydrogenase TcuA [Proteobacteria bacterium]|nr:FAD-dependent tricarballylate dehydrogenase TcuA [Pseudomonadota bacterium]
MRLPTWTRCGTTGRVRSVMNRDAEVLVIGGGIAGLSAAIAAREAGARVHLIECAPRHHRGGNARHARNLRIAHDAPTPFTPDSYTQADFVAELERAAAGHADPALVRSFVAQTEKLVPWLAAQGVLFQRAGDGRLPYSHRTAFLFGGGMTLVNTLYARAERLGVRVEYGVTAEAPAIEAGRAVHVDLRTPLGPVRAMPPATIICGGGAQGDPMSLRPHWGAAADGFVLRGVPYADGRLLRGLLAQGVAQAGVAGACHLVAVDARSPRADGGIVTRVLGIPHGIVVNRDAQRFHDEGADTAQTRYAVWGRMIAQQPGQIAWLVLDAAAEQRIPPLVFPPLRAPTPAALAACLGLDPVAFARCVAVYNDAVDPSGRTSGLMPEKTRYARRLDTPPFAAVPVRPGITFTCEGVRVDAQARVLRQDGAPLANLFAAGTMMAPNILGTGYLAGAAMSVAAVFGRIAGAAAARMVAASRLA